MRTEVTDRKYATNLGSFQREPRSGSIYQPGVGASGANPRLESNPSPTLKGLNTQAHLQSMVVSNLHFIETVKRGFVQPLQGCPIFGWSKPRVGLKSSRPILGWKIEPLRGSRCPPLLFAPHHMSFGYHWRQLGLFAERIVRLRKSGVDQQMNSEPSVESVRHDECELS